MRPWEPLLLAIVLTSAGLAGCLGGDQAPEGSPPAAEEEPWPRCQHPWPCADGSEWPVDLVGPFEILDPEHVTVESFDGTLLDGWIWRPELPEGVAAPVILETDPYLGTCIYQYASAGTPYCRGSGGSDARLDSSRAYDELIAAGYAVALFSVRGTGGSGGCYDLWGLDEQRDQVALVEHLAAQPWSNGRVAMNGISYSGTTPFEAAIHQAPSLKAIVGGGIVTDPYLGPASPQGAIARGYDRFRAGTVTANSMLPPLGGGQDTLLPYAPVAHERACPEVADVLSNTPRDQASDERLAAFWEERRLVSRFAEVQAAVLVMQGFHDDSFHRYQEDAIWSTLTQAPKSFVLGQWGHTGIFDEQMATYPHGESWLERSLDWYRFWLKGLGDPPARLGAVDYQLSSGSWRNDTAWPPTAARLEALHLGDGALVPAATDHSAALSLAPIQDDSVSCADDPPASPSGAPPQRHYATEPVDGPVSLAGNPVARLSLESDQPRGLFAVGLFDVGPGWSCQAGGEAELLSHGRVDLGFHAGTMRASDFPVGEPTEVRVDLYNLAHRLEPGHRLLLVIRNGDDLMGQQSTGTLTVHGASQLILPLVEGSLGGQPPTAGLAPRPFLPAG